MTAFEHPSKNPVGIITSFIRAFAGLVVDPDVDDHLAGRVIPKEQTVLLEELCSEPVLACFAKGGALSILLPGWILRNDFKLIYFPNSLSSPDAVFLNGPRSCWMTVQTK